MPFPDFAGPAIRRSIASSISAKSTWSLFSRTARIAASLRMFSISAPEKPTVRRAKASQETLGSIFLLRAWTLKIASRPARSGRFTVMVRSKRPARSKAGSRTSSRLVAAITRIPVLASKPSISTSNWFNVCSRSSLPPPKPAPR
ncbi:MAG: hypothetical protein BWY98_00162 [Tenericutes bacterium ADurb.BinA155]|nr:MAG: hypothetical protein BWY98_00162 [Tenericutes bacterium ADurb.BinA155]